MPIQTERNLFSIQKMIPVNLFLNEWKEMKINVKFVLAFESCTESKLMATMTLTHLQLITLFYELDKISKLENFYFPPDKLLSLLDHHFHLIIIFNTLNLKKIFWKTKSYNKKKYWKTVFYLKVLWLKT